MLTRVGPDARTLADTGKLEARSQSLDELGRKVEQFQQDLAVVDADYRKTFEQKRRTAAELAATLPPDAVLVDVRMYARAMPNKQKAGIGTSERGSEWHSEWHLVTFVIRKDKKVARVELGPTAAVESALQSWRRVCVNGSAPPGAELRKLIWEPLLERAGNQMTGANVVLWSPDGPLGGFPIGALPGSKPGTFLIEDVAIAEVPVPVALPELLEPATLSKDQSRPSLLLVGDVDYDRATYMLLLQLNPQLP